MASNELKNLARFDVVDGKLKSHPSGDLVFFDRVAEIADQPSTDKAEQEPCNYADWPERIYLQRGEDEPHKYDGLDLENVYWCQNQIFDVDVPYVRADLASTNTASKESAQVALSERKQFERWYACNAFDYERNPIGSRECGLQWAAWQARSQVERYVWQPIETAPKDGSYILLANKAGCWIGNYRPVYQSGYRPINPWSSIMLNHDYIAIDGRFGIAIAWMPLLAASSPAQEGE